MDGVPYHHALNPHMEPLVPRIEGVSSLVEFVELARSECFEGIVIVVEDGTHFKMRCEMVEGNANRSRGYYHFPSSLVQRWTVATTRRQKLDFGRILIPKQI